MLVLVLSVSIISCSKDDAGTKNSSNLENTLMQYCWRSDENVDFMEWGDNEASLSRDNVTLYFLGDGAGVMKVNYHEIDSYFGTSSSVETSPFTYYVSGSTVTMYLKQTVTCTYNGNALVSTNSTWNFNKKSLTSDDQKWLKKAVYEVMPDEERCDIKFDHSCKYLYSAEGDVNVEVTLSLSASEMASARKIQMLTATYKGPGIRKSGYGTSYMDYQKQTNEILISDDKDYKVSKILSFKGELPLTLDVTFSVWDGKNQEEVYLGSEEIVITGEGETSEDASGDEEDKKNNDGANDDSGEMENGGENSGNKNYTAEYSGVYNGHKYVDLGLNVNWAFCNVDATSPEGAGGYYAWGETETKEMYSFRTYEHGNKMDTDGMREFYDIGKEISGTQYDVAHVKWGGKWRMPTLEERQELKEKCVISKTSYNGVKGILITGPNGNSVFLPSAGHIYLKTIRSKGTTGEYWTGTFAHSVLSWPYTIAWGGVPLSVEVQYFGLPVRPVFDRNN